MRLQSRLDALEQMSGTGLAHCVLWHHSVPFHDAFAFSDAATDSRERLLIELVPGRAERNSISMTSGQRDEQTKAYAWADGTGV